MHFILLLLLILALVFGPQLWVKYVLRKYSSERNDFPGTGGELARHLLDRFHMEYVRVEITERGDHYDPAEKVVRLSPGNHDKKSLTAIAVAAHEVGHAIQHHQGETKLALRTRLVHVAYWAEKIGAMAMVAMPVVAAITRAPAVGGGMLVLGLLSLGMAALVHLVTLPVEWDASFGKALPVLKSGQYISAEDEKAVRKILRAAAMTYVAASLASLLNLWRWLRLLRR